MGGDDSRRNDRSDQNSVAEIPQQEFSCHDAEYREHQDDDWKLKRDSDRQHNVRCQIPILMDGYNGLELVPEADEKRQRLGKGKFVREEPAGDKQAARQENKRPNILLLVTVEPG